MKFSKNGYLDLKVGYACNNDCIHCVIRDYEAGLIADGKSLNLATQECLEIISTASLRGFSTITLTGGEPTIRDDFIALLLACRIAGLRVGVQTNGRRFHDPAFCNRLKCCGSPRFVVALHGPDAVVHDAISRRSGSFEQTCQGIQNLCSAGYSVVGKLVISRRNAGLLTETMDLMASLGVEEATFAFPHGHGNARIHYREIVPRYSDIRAGIDRLTRAAAASGFNLSLEAFPLCVLDEPRYVAEFQYMAPGNRCCIPSHSDEFDWDAMRPLEKLKFAQCPKCSFDPFCEGPWKEYPDMYGEAEFQPRTAAELLGLLAAGLTQVLSEEGRLP